MLNKCRYLVYSYDESEKLFRVHFIGSLRACTFAIDAQARLTRCSKFGDIFKTMSVSDFARFHVLVGAKVSYPMNMSKRDLDELKVDVVNPLYTAGFSISDRFENGK